MKSKVEEICKISRKNPDCRIYQVPAEMQAFNADDKAVMADGFVRIQATNDKHGRTLYIHFHQGDPSVGFMIRFSANRLEDLFQHMTKK